MDPSFAVRFFMRSRTRKALNGDLDKCTFEI